VKNYGREKLKKVNWRVNLRRCSNFRAVVNVYPLQVVTYASLLIAAELAGSDALERYLTLDFNIILYTFSMVNKHKIQRNSISSNIILYFKIEVQGSTKEWSFVAW
jgi:hypothetical protein